MIRMSYNQHRHNLARINRFLDTAGALGVNVDNQDMFQELLEMTFADNYPSDTRVRLYLKKWGILDKWDEYQATERIRDILDYRLR